MARNEEKAQLMLNKWTTMKMEFNAGNLAERRPFLATDCESLGDCEKWRMQIVKEITKKVAEIQNKGLGEHKIRDLNDRINKLLREKGHWQHRIRQLGGPDYNALEPKALDAEGRPLPGGGGYRYFGAARELPGVKELFEAPAPVKKRRTRKDMMQHVTPDYYGFRDDDDKKLAEEEAVCAAAAMEGLKAKEAEEKRKRRERRKVDGEPLGESSDDDPETELDFLREVDEAARDANAAFEEHATLQHKAKKRAMDAANDDLDAKKRRLLDLVEEAE